MFIHKPHIIMYIATRRIYKIERKQTSEWANEDANWFFTTNVWMNCYIRTVMSFVHSQSMHTTNITSFYIFLFEENDDDVEEEVSVVSTSNSLEMTLSKFITQNSMDFILCVRLFELKIEIFFSNSILHYKRVVNQFFSLFRCWFFPSKETQYKMNVHIKKWNYHNY